MIACQLERYRFTRLPVGMVLAGDMFQWKIDEIFKGLPMYWVLLMTFFIVGYDANGRDL